MNLKRDLIFIAIGLICLMAFACANFWFGYSYAHKDVALLKQQLTEAKQVTMANDSVLKDCNDETTKAQKAEAAAELRAEKASKDFDVYKSQQVTVTQSFATQLITLPSKPECSALKEHICPAAMGY